MLPCQQKEDDMNDSQEYDAFYAICNHEPGGDNRVLRVGGKVQCPTSGWSAHFEETQGNTGINPNMLHLDLVATKPGGNVLDRLEWIDIDEWRQDPPAREYDEVEFHRADGDPPPRIKVDHPE
jgi:hypothetical protein